MKLFDFDAVILDLDFTIWSASAPRVWAKTLTPPYRFHWTDNTKSIEGGDYWIELQFTLETILHTLYAHNIEMGFITRGGLQNVQFDEQPPVICLKMFDIIDYFTFCQIVMYVEDGPKSVQLNKLFENTPSLQGKSILYIDDNQREVEDVKENCKWISHVINRNTFTEWKELLWIKL